jgi:hypothetical protein
VSGGVEPIFPGVVDPAFGPVGPSAYPRRELSRPEKYERLAFTFCRLGTTGLIAWALGPPLFVLVVSLVAIGLYARSISLGVHWSKCLLRRPSLIIAFWAVIAAADAYWLVVLGGRALV